MKGTEPIKKKCAFKIVRKGQSMKTYNYLIRRKFLNFLGQKFYIYDANGQLLAFCKQKAFKLKEDIRLYSDESMSMEFLTIKARNIIDFSACYDVYDSTTGEHLGAWRRKGFTSIIRDKWQLIDCNDNLIAEVNEDNMGLALLRRLVCNLIPQEFVLGTEFAPLVRYSQFFNPFIFKLGVNISPQCDLHPSLLLAGGILLAAIEGRQQ